MARFFTDDEYTKLSDCEKLLMIRSGEARFTREQKAKQFGDSSPEFLDRHISNARELLERLDKGLPLGQTDYKRARAIRKAVKAAKTGSAYDPLLEHIVVGLARLP